VAGFETHIGTSTAIGIAYGAAGFYLGLPIESSVLAGGLCSMAGMLPDLDSDSGVPVREMLSLTAATVPLLLYERFQKLGVSHETLVAMLGATYLAVRFGVGEIFKRYTVHRGMWHSLPAMFTAGFIAFLLASGNDVAIRGFKAGGVMLGFLSHLVLDEIWSFGVKGGKLSVKRSFGTALKFWGKDRWANGMAYSLLTGAALLGVGDPVMMQRYGEEIRVGDKSAKEWFEKAAEMAGIQPAEPETLR
jgi:membrane-bound metal-dependent hydrolase YbcI (DUF457 family)